MAGRYRAWCMTWNNPDEALTPEIVSQWPDIRAGVWQLEMGEDGTVHYQGYFEFTVAKTIGPLKQVIHQAHWERRMGTQAQAIRYCIKPDIWDGENIPDETRLEGPFNFGVWAQVGNPGKRNDFQEAIRLIKEGANNATLAQEVPGVGMRYARGIEWLRLNLPQPVFDPATKVKDCIMYWGPPRTGKSYRLRLECPLGPDWFWASPGKWFDGYEGQPGIVFDEIRDSWMPWEEILRVIDGYPIRRETKGGTIQVRAIRFRMSSNVHPKFWYQGAKGHPNQPWRDSPLRARFSHIILMDQPVLLQGVVQVIDEDEPPDAQQFVQDGNGVLWAARAMDELMAPRPLPAWNAQGDPGPQ